MKEGGQMWERLGEPLWRRRKKRKRKRVREGEASHTVPTGGKAKTPKST